MRLPRLIFTPFIKVSNSSMVIPTWRSLSWSGRISISSSTVPLMSAMATSGSCSTRLMITSVANRLSREKPSLTGKRSLSGTKSAEPSPVMFR